MFTVQTKYLWDVSVWFLGHINKLNYPKTFDIVFISDPCFLSFCEEIAAYYVTISFQDSINIDDLDEEDMAKMDEALSNVFRSICKKKSAGIKKKEKMDSLAIMHFKIRTLDMVKYKDFQRFAKQ